MPTIRNVGDIARWHLCLGCGACAAVCPAQKIRLVDVAVEGIRPLLADTACGACTDCLAVCPGWQNDHRHLASRAGAIPELLPVCGPVLEIWEGHASDAVVRHQGASGGILSALAVFALEYDWTYGVLHTGADPADPLRNRTTLSRTRQEVLACTGSRYAPASVCDSLAAIERAPSPCLFIGQPSEVTALRKAQQLRPELDRNVALALSFFCAGTPARAGTVAVLAALGLRPEDVRSVRYRGLGWPGRFVAYAVDSTRVDRSMSYADSWDLLQSYRPFATHLSPDGTGEDADISCGDAWHRRPSDTSAGSSLILVRTEAGRSFLRRAREAGCVQLSPGDPAMLRQSQANLIAKRRAVRGRVAALRALRLPAPQLRGFFPAESGFALRDRTAWRGFFSTLRRIVRRRLFRPEPAPVGPEVLPCASALSFPT